MQDGQRLVGYWIGKTYWAKGIATKALSAFLTHVQERPLYAYVAEHNVGSLRVLKKCGFTISGDNEGASQEVEDQIQEVVLELRA